MKNTEEKLRENVRHYALQYSVILLALALLMMVAGQIIHIRRTEQRLNKQYRLIKNLSQQLHDLDKNFTILPNPEDIDDLDFD